MVKGSNSDFGTINIIHFYGWEVFAVLSVSIFMHENVILFFTEIVWYIYYIGDNEEIVIKISNFIENRYYYHKLSINRPRCYSTNKVPRSKQHNNRKFSPSSR